MTLNELVTQIANHAGCDVQSATIINPANHLTVVFYKNGQNYTTTITPETDVTAKALEVRNALHKASQPQMKPPERKDGS